MLLAFALGAVIPWRSFDAATFIVPKLNGLSGNIREGMKRLEKNEWTADVKKYYGDHISV